MRVGAPAVLVVVALGAAAPPEAAVRTFVDLVRTDEAATRLGRPSIRVEIRGALVPGTETLEDDLVADLGRMVHLRPLAEGEAGDFVLDLRLLEMRQESRMSVLPFEARLLEPDGREVWMVEGRTEIEAAPCDASAIASVRRNVVSALIRDGWLQLKDDPDHPAPPPPVVTRGDL